MDQKEPTTSQINGSSINPNKEQPLYISDIEGNIYINTIKRKGRLLKCLLQLLIMIMSNATIGILIYIAFFKK